jgi:hypothetical protein
MKIFRLSFGLLALCLIAGCVVSVGPVPTATPKPLLPSPTQPCVNDPFCVPTATPTSTPAASVLLEVSLEGCNWGIDITHGMGEVTNAYLLVRNTGPLTIHDLCLELFASDEGREHPDKSRCYLALPVGKQMAVKLTVDTTYGTDTDFYVTVTSDEISLQLPTQRCQPIKDGVQSTYDKVLDVIQDLSK